MIDPTVRQLLEEAIDSPIKLQLLLLFHESPRIQLTATQVANRIYRDIWSTREALHELHQDGVLAAEGEELRYSYRPRIEYIERITRLVYCYNEPIERDRLQHTLREISDDATYRRVRHKIRGAFELESI